MTHPQPVTARTQVIIDMIIQFGWDTRQELGYPLFPGPEILPDPDRSVWITPTGGPGYTTEEAGTDTWSFQARVRGASDDPLGPELAAQQLDTLILNGPYPSVIDGVPVLVASRVSSPPVPLGLAPDERRFEYTCSYLITTGGG